MRSGRAGRTALRAARSCYDHLAGVAGVALHDDLLARGWIVPAGEGTYEVSPAGADAFAALGIDIVGVRASRRRFAYTCADWTERRPHLAGALGAAVLETLLRRRWFVRESEGRALQVTAAGRRALRGRTARGRAQR